MHEPLTLPRVPAPFAWDGDFLTIALTGAQALFTTRHGGVSTGAYASLNLGRRTEDDPAAVAENRARVAARVGVEESAILYGRQVHGTDVRRTLAGAARPEPIGEEDGQATSERGRPAMALGADCLPIVLAAPGAVASLHGGWPGLANGIVAEGVKALREFGATGPITAAIGPGVGGCCYEVGPEVLERFPASVADGRLLDLHAAAREQLYDAGAETVHDCGLCTICAGPGLFFSHRRDRGITGRQAGLVWLT